MWNERYAGEGYLFGTAPNAFLASQAGRLQPGMSCLAVADGEGRNGVWLAEQGLRVVSVDGASVAVEKAKALAKQRGVTLDCQLADLAEWRWPEGEFDVVVGIFIQFVGAAGRAEQFANLKRCLKPGGLLLLQGYTPRQLEYRTGGPSQVENLYTAAMLREAFGDMEILHLAEHDAEICEGTGHCGRSALVDLVVRKNNI